MVTSLESLQTNSTSMSLRSSLNSLSSSIVHWPNTAIVFSFEFQKHQGLLNKYLGSYEMKMCCSVTFVCVCLNTSTVSGQAVGTTR